MKIKALVTKDQSHDKNIKTLNENIIKNEVQIKSLKISDKDHFEMIKALITKD